MAHSHEAPAAASWGSLMQSREVTGSQATWGEEYGKAAPLSTVSKENEQVIAGEGEGEKDSYLVRNLRTMCQALF